MAAAAPAAAAASTARCKTCPAACPTGSKPGLDCVQKRCLLSPAYGGKRLPTLLVGACRWIDSDGLTNAADCQNLKVLRRDPPGT